MHENVLLDQQLANHLRRKQYGEALRIALRRDKPLQALKVLTSIIESDLAQNLPNRNGFPAVQAVAKGWSDDELLKVLRYCREWNSRARNCHVAMVVVNAVVSSTPLSRLAAINGVPEVLGGILVYAERHRDRLDRLRTSSYLLDFVLSNMGSLDKAGSAPAGADDGTVDAATGAVVAEFAEWEQRTMGRRLVLPPKHVDGRIQVGGTAVVGGRVGGAVRTVEAKRGGGGGDDDDPMGVSSDGSIESVVADDSDDSSSQSASSGR
jgi:U3 small nucleolar RNA-associated protein 13